MRINIVQERFCDSPMLLHTQPASKKGGHMPGFEGEEDEGIRTLLRLIEHDEKGELNQVFESDYKEEVNPDEIKIGVKRCPGIIRNFECIATGFGEGPQASSLALKAFQADETAKLAKALAAAQAWGSKKVCTPPCVDHGILLGQISATQQWHNDIHSTPVKAYTWRIVGYQVTKFCS
ncbi:MAG: hypothetical protein ABSD59_05035 [Terracidiphilus sp.]